MERRMWIGIGILVLFFLLGLYTAHSTQQACYPIGDMLQQACDYAAIGQWDAAAALTLRANKKWDALWNRLALIADHSPMDEIDGLFSQAKMYARTDAVQDFSATCARLSQLVDAIADAHKMTWWNLL